MMPRRKDEQKFWREAQARSDPRQLKLPEINQKEESARQKKMMKKRKNGKTRRKKTKTSGE